MVQPLFANQRETNLVSTTRLVENVLHELARGSHSIQVSPIPQVPTRTPRVLRAWRVARGSAVAQVMMIEAADFTHLRVEADVMTLDGKVDRPALYAHLLDLNGSLCGAAFAIAGDHVLLVTERSTLDLDRSEVRDLIDRLATYADEHDDALVAKFGGALGRT